MALNFDKTIILQFGKFESIISIKIDNFSIVASEFTKFLGIKIDDRLTWKQQINTLETKLHKDIFVLSQLFHSIRNTEIKKTYFAFFHSHLSYGTILWAHNISNQDFNCIFKLQKAAIRLIKFGNRNIVSCRGLFKELRILTFVCIYILQSVIYAKRFLYNSKVGQTHMYFTRRYNCLSTNYNINTIDYLAAKIFNKIPNNITDLPMKQMKCKLKEFLIQAEFYNQDEFWISNF